MSKAISHPPLLKRHTIHGLPDKSSGDYICLSSLQYVKGMFEIGFLVRTEMFYSVGFAQGLEVTIQPNKSEGVYTSDVNIILTFLHDDVIYDEDADEETSEVMDSVFVLQTKDMPSREALKALLKNRNLKFQVTVFDEYNMRDHCKVYNLEMEHSLYEELRESARLLKEFCRQTLA